MNKTKKGAASIYVVVFVTLLLGVITVGFVRVILREARNTTEDELSESARDSALTGIEDAKRAIKKYYQCKSGLVTDCPAFFPNMNDCAFVGKVLGKIVDPAPDKPEENEVLIKTLDTGDSHTEQAYTCVTVSDESEDYLGKLTPDQTVAVIPLRATNLSTVKKIRFSWHTPTDPAPTLYNTASNYPKKDSATLPTPPVISLQYIAGDSPSYQTDTLFLNPSDDGSASTSGKFNGNLTSSLPYKVKCTGTDYKCSFTADIIASATPQLLVVSLPYGAPETNFRVEMLDNSGKTVKFVGVQLIVDSTGRANDMFARIETRLMNADPNFPYPQFALQIGEDGITKNFWATKHCKKIDNGSVDNCDNSGTP